MEPTEQDKKEAVIHFLIHHQLPLKSLCKDILQQRKNLFHDEPPEFHADIDKECTGILKNIITTEVAKNLALDSLTVSEVLEDFDIMGYLS